MSKEIKTPGVYIEEEKAIPSSVAEVETAIPAFVGYTEKASRDGKTLVNKPTRITSLAEYHQLFGGGFSPTFTLDKATPASKHKLTIGGTERAIEHKAHNLLYLFNAIKFFYANGGGPCFIVSVGTYEGKDSLKIEKDELLGQSKSAPHGGLKALEKEQEPTMLVIPDAVVLGDDCYEVYRQMLAQCGQMQNRVAILDIQNGYKARSQGKDDIITNFREKIGTENLDYSAAYYPWMHTSIIAQGEITFENLDESIELEVLLPEKKAKAILLSGGLTAHEKHLGLMTNSATYVLLMEEIRTIVNLQPVAAAMAGVYATVDNSRGVWKAPANVGMNSALKPAVKITNDQQENLNVDVISGKSINAIRTFPGVGTLVWGARTLAGNNLEWRYINVRRTFIMLEESIKLALRAYVFEPNDANTWVTVKGMIVNFLTDKWKQGALAGSTPSDAFNVQVGLGTTMTALDIQEGKMLVQLSVAVVRPAEFIVITFEQQMMKS